MKLFTGSRFGMIQTVLLQLLFTAGYVNVWTLPGREADTDNYILWALSAVCVCLVVAMGRGYVLTTTNSIWRNPSFGFPFRIRRQDIERIDLGKRFLVVATLNDGTTRAVGNPFAGIFASRKAALRARERLVSQLASWAANSDPDELDAA
jgi:hypothetical protein